MALETETKPVNNLGPQKSFPVSEDILNHNGINYIALTLWAQDPQGARLGGLDLVPSMLVRSDCQTTTCTPTCLGASIGCILAHYNDTCGTLAYYDSHYKAEGSVLYAGLKHNIAKG
jgi:hypothetical protein